MREKLIQVGLNTYEAKAYEVLLVQGLLSASKVSELADIPQGRVYATLKSLEKKGFCNMFSGSVKKFKAVSPKIAFKKVIESREKELGEIEQLGEELEEIFKTQNTDTAPSDFIQILTSKQSQVNKFDELIKASEKTLYSFNKRPYATGFLRDMDEIIKASKPLRKILKKGTSVKALFETEEGQYQQEFIRMIQYYQEIGEEVRICKRLPLKMLLSDNSKAMVSMRSQDTVDFKLTSMIVEHSDLTAALVELFEMYWDKGMTIATYLKSTTTNQTTAKK